MTNTKTKKRLTQKQRVFVNEIAKGNTQRQACILAYPKAKNWTTNTIDVRANALMKNEVVKEALQNINKEEKKEVLWTREKATQTILYLIDTAEAEQEKIRIAFYNELKIKEKIVENLEKQWLLAETDKEHLQIEYKLLKAKEDVYKHLQIPKQSTTCNRAIFQGTDILNRMYGYKNLGWECIEEETEKTLKYEKLKALADSLTKQKKQ